MASVLGPLEAEYSRDAVADVFGDAPLRQRRTRVSSILRSQARGEGERMRVIPSGLRRHPEPGSHGTGPRVGMPSGLSSSTCDVLGFSYARVL